MVFIREEYSLNFSIYNYCVTGQLSLLECAIQRKRWALKFDFVKFKFFCSKYYISKHNSRFTFSNYVYNEAFNFIPCIIIVVYDDNLNLLKEAEQCFS